MLTTPLPLAPPVLVDAGPGWLVTAAEAGAVSGATTTSVASSPISPDRTTPSRWGAAVRRPAGPPPALLVDGADRLVEGVRRFRSPLPAPRAAAIRPAGG